MAFTAKDVQELRTRTSAGMMDCKKALVECDGNMDKAAEYLREKGIATAAKKQGRVASQGVVDTYIHMGGKIGVMVEINCETDFVAKTDAFKAFAHDIALQIAASNPKFVETTEVPQEDLEKEKEILKAQALNEGKPVAIIDRMVEGRIKKYYQDVCLLEQTFVKDGSLTIRQLLTEATATIGEKISIRRFVRFEMGEGLAKKVDNFADEINEQVAKMQANNA
ncbi:MAG: translation elongation factor Ts [Bacillota bacterium]